MVKIPTIEEMLKAGMHFGHQKSKWHPRMAPYIFTDRKGVHIIDLTKSQKMLKDALELMKNLTKEGKVILFVGTKSQVKAPITKMAKELDVPYVTGKWLGGLLTNFGTIKKSIKKYIDLVEKKSSGKLDKYTKKERLEIDRQIGKLELKVGGVSKLNKLPDVLFVWDVKNEGTAIAEATKMEIPIIAVCDTNVNPKFIKHIIPSNDDATKTIKLVLKLVQAAIQEGKDEIKK